MELGLVTKNTPPRSARARGRRAPAENREKIPEKGYLPDGDLEDFAVSSFGPVFAPSVSAAS